MTRATPYQAGCDTGDAGAPFALSGLSAADVSGLLKHVYRGPTESTPWASLLEWLRERFDATFATLVLRNPASEHAGLIVNASVYGALLPGEPSYSETYYAMCPFTELPAGQTITGDEMFGEAAWSTHEFYLEYMKPLDLRYVLASALRTDTGVECTLFVTRGHRSQDFGAADKALIAVLSPHLQQAVALYNTLDELEAERILYAGTIDRMRVGTAILDESGRVIKRNLAADRLLAAADGVYLSQGALHAHCPIEHRKFQKLVDAALEARLHATTPRMEVTTLSRPGGTAPLSVLIRSIPRTYDARERLRRPALAVFIRDPVGSPEASRETLRKLFHLTPNETELALLLVDGLTLDEAAEALGVAKNTARTHLRGVFAKTGATRQAVLVKMLLNSVVGMV
ncbi:helix-turn-helix transcriptional regulator [Pandoraea terrae]|uniref:Helix-turn-helix transcriptional regulator n=1 Tax=Pandoraea terrae TaxID=1537710 RepID=A0A5E4Z2Z2_9BURK|nr:LuxR C-terminal-related transcriptional regulator [Pandoraea terrae]VVE55449.1 helix-turn-helix transcriptional regulator [Pandoraea terrae]